MGNYDASEVESAICRIRGVISARISFDAQGELDELNVLATSARNAKQIVRDIESLCIARFGLRIDHRHVSVAQIAVQDDEEYASSERTVRIGRVVESFDSGCLDVEVELILGHAMRRARASGPGRGGNRVRLFALAAIDALGSLMHGMCSLQLEDAFLVPLRRGSAATVVATLVFPGFEETLVGIAWVRNNDGEAVVRACLNAVGRRIAIAYGDMVPDDENSFEDAPAPLSPQDENAGSENSGTWAQG